VLPAKHLSASSAVFLIRVEELTPEDAEDAEQKAIVSEQQDLTPLRENAACALVDMPER